jgi:hypothetical protein
VKAARVLYNDESQSVNVTISLERWSRATQCRVSNGTSTFIIACRGDTANSCLEMTNVSRATLQAMCLAMAGHSVLVLRERGVCLC